ncbi:nuclear transport factor 2 family protein [Gilvimarinus sp. SDUM040013]|uniref:Nuclear transport factor 2 family protein n=1 Tax=Gilvimarinus gilvus TaxID=3058038 RepID=A0ABU4S5L3_9GAMM|nr:nuclear transport factor 2 family protein [Gilvimarinus sp. SDUM040013]MDO3385566.1 nuclear transport factor 2 family protein [Gilvimarinus sp. SDUM040013]MDX6851183.1 nuclear transport factor 2 family protein [Gilvimarinus sp. SDUM040013]
MKTEEENGLIEKLTGQYQSFSAGSIDSIVDLYSEDVEFIDPVQRIVGRSALRSYFQALGLNLTFCHFSFSSTVKSRGDDGNDIAVLFWIMRFSHPKLNGGNASELSGCSHIIYTDKVIYQRDYYDLGEMVYESIPLLGSVIRRIKLRLGEK